jgi:hypothetical protein
VPVNRYTADTLAGVLGSRTGGFTPSAGDFAIFDSCAVGGKVGADGAESELLEDLGLLKPDGPVAVVLDAELGVRGVGVGQVEQDLDGVGVPGMHLVRKAI